MTLNALFMKRSFFLGCCLFMGSLLNLTWAQQPTYTTQYTVNTLWSAMHGNPGSPKPYVAALTTQNRLILAGNTKASANQTHSIAYGVDCALGVCNTALNLTSNSNDYAIDIQRGAVNGNLFVLSAAKLGSSNPDFRLSRLDPAGTSATWNSTFGTGSADLPQSMVMNGSTAYIVTLQESNNKDAGLWSVGLNGSANWNIVYDYAGAADMPAAVALAPDGTVIMCGISEDLSGNAAIFVNRYSTAGNIVATNRYTKAGYDFTESPVGMEVDANGNIFVAGAANNGLDLDAYLICFNSQLQPVWDDFRGQGGVGKADRIGAMTLTRNGVAVSGSFSHFNHNGISAITRVYDAVGNIEWESELGAANDQLGTLRVADMVLEKDILFIAGEDIAPGSVGSQAFVCGYDLSGNAVFLKRNTVNGMPFNAATSVVAQNDLVYVNWKAEGSNGASSYATTAYQILQSPIIPVMDVTGKETSHVEDEIIAWFQPQHFSTSFADNSDIRFAPLSDVLRPAAVTALENAWGIQADNLIARKIVPPFWTSQAQTMLHRDGLRQVDVPPFWSAVVIQLPSGSDEIQMAAQINTTAMWDWVRMAHPNGLGQVTTGVPADPRYPAQASFHPDTNNVFRFAHINAEGAFCEFEQRGGDPGKWNKVAIFDTGLDWKHEDFSVNGTQTFSGASPKIAGGEDFFTSVPLAGMAHPDIFGHGTSCAGIIGALGDNGVGIAGMDGGNISQFGTTGCQFYGVKIADDSGDGIIQSNVISAMAQSMADTTWGGYGVHFTNHSWAHGATFGSATSRNLQREAFDAAARLGVTHVVSRGNSRGRESGQNTNQYPATYATRMVITCTAADQDGDYHDGSAGDNWWSSNFGGGDYLGGVAVMAPGGFSELTHTTCTTDTIARGIANFDSTGYSTFNGTSCAAPHALGVAVFASDFYGQNGQPTQFLFPEDHRHILMNSARDRDDPGYDIRTGAGMVDAGRNTRNTDPSEWQYAHSITGIGGGRQTRYWGLEGGPQNPRSLHLIADVGNLSAGIYYGDVYMFQLKIETSGYFAPGDSIEEVWELKNESDIWGYEAGTGIVNPDPAPWIYHWNQDSTRMRGCTFFFRYNSLGQVINQWHPIDPTTTKPKMECTWKVHRNNSVGINEDFDLLGNLTVFPNPSSSEIYLRHSLEAAGEVTVSIFDVQGRLLQTSNLGIFSSGDYTHRIPLNDYSSGLYFVQLRTGKESQTKKIVVNN